ncbi:MAG: two-component system regulatory protein YycI [Firmicutes bacterium]|nr:two-component system regulatory protein YycI [Dethiobacter sp.]MBS3887772.1 two-component system regulatory protein YycI [Bacillota bacterium]
MDWGRVKTLLIVSFLILNILLAGRLYFVPELEMYLGLTDRASSEAVLRALQAHEVVLTGTLPTVALRAPFAQVSLRRLNHNDIDLLRRQILGDEAVHSTIATTDDRPLVEQPTSFVLGHEDLVITTQGYISYHNRAVAKTEAPLDAEQAVQVAEEFFRHRMDGPRDFVFDSVIPLEEGSYRVEYVQTFRGNRIFPGYIIMVIKGGEVAAMWMSRLNVALEAGGAKPVLPASGAVLSLLNHRLNRGETGAMEVLEVLFGYHSPIYDAIDPSWRGVPVWRIRTNAGVYFINAHSGVPESWPLAN